MKHAPIHRPTRRGCAQTRGSHPAPARVRAALLLGLASFISLSGGCHSYERKPLDSATARASWTGRTASDESVGAYAARLASAEGRVDAAFDPSDGLSLAEAEPVALVFNRDLRVARLEADVTRVRAGLAGVWEDPVAGVDIERILSGVSEPWVLSGAIGLTLPISGRLAAEKDRAKAEHAAELHRIAALEWATRSALRELWIRYSAQAHRLRSETDLNERLRGVADLSSRQADAGTMTRVDARVFRVELAARDASLIQTRARLRELELELRDLLGLAPDAPVRLVETLTFAERAAEVDLDAVDEGNAELAAVRSRYEVAEASLRLEIRKQYPDLHLAPGFGVDEGEERVLLGVQLPLPLWNGNRAGIAAAVAEREAAGGRFANTYESLGSRLAIAQVLHEASRAARESIETTLVPLTDEQVTDVRRIAELGRVDALLLLQALNAEHDAKLKLVEARAAEAIAAIRLDELAGPPRPSPAAPPVPAPIQGARP